METSAVVAVAVTLGVNAVLIVAGVILLIFRVWDLGVWAVTVGAGIPVLVILAVAGVLTEWWSFGLGILALLVLAGCVNMLLQSRFPGRPLAPLSHHQDSPEQFN